MTKEKHEIKAQIRTLVGKKVKKLRKDGLIPATLYGKGIESISLQFNSKEFEKIFENVGESGLVEILIDDKKYPVLFKNPQYNPINGFCIHIDCHKVNLKEKIKATIPVELIGESDAVKAGNILVQINDEIEVEALPSDLPEKIEVDISVLKEAEQMITVADLTIGDKKVEIISPAETVIAKVETPKEEIIEETVAPEDVPATEQKSPETENKEESSEKKEEA